MDVHCTQVSATSESLSYNNSEQINIQLSKKGDQNDLQDHNEGCHHFHFLILSSKTPSEHNSCHFCSPSSTTKKHIHSDKKKQKNVHSEVYWDPGLIYCMLALVVPRSYFSPPLVVLMSFLCASSSCPEIMSCQSTFQKPQALFHI